MDTSKPKHTTACLWMMGTILSFSAMAVAGREVSFALGTFEIMLYRSFIGMLIVSAALTGTQQWSQVKTGLLRNHFWRNVVHFTGQNLWFFAVSAIPLAQVFALEFTTPLWVIALSPFLLHERLTRPKLIAGGLGFVGVLILTQPGSHSLSVGLLAAASCALFFALTAIATKRLTQQEGVVSIMFWLTAMQLIFGVLAAGYDGAIALPDATTAPWLVLIAFCGLSAHFCLTTALSLAPASVVLPIDFARLPVIAVVGYLLYRDPLDLWMVLGAAVIILANYINLTAAGNPKTAKD